MKDQTFFWFSKDDYMQKSTRNNVLTFPTARERAGDFSQSRRHHLRPADHPAEPERHRLHPRPVPGQRHSRQSPQPDRAGDAHADADADLGPLVQRSASLDDGPQDQETVKIDQRWDSRWTTTGMYAHQHTA